MAMPDREIDISRHNLPPGRPDVQTTSGNPNEATLLLAAAVSSLESWPPTCCAALRGEDDSSL